MISRSLKPLFAQIGTRFVCAAARSCHYRPALEVGRETTRPILHESPDVRLNVRMHFICFIPSHDCAVHVPAELDCAVDICVVS